MTSVLNKDKEYLNIVGDILVNDEFLLMKDLVHHGMSRFDHSVRVSYYAYKAAKYLGLNAEDVARGGLLHDFFFEKYENTFKERMNIMFNHPKFALSKASEHFDLTEKEMDIILSHMWPVSIRAPRYAESWLVDCVDNAVSICEKTYSVRAQLNAAFNILFFLFINYLRLT